MKVVTLGEILLRLTPPFGTPLSDAESLSVRFGGSEANVAVALAGFGEETAHITAFPQNAVGQAAENNLKKFGVDTRFAVRVQGRMGLYYYEQGASLRAGRVVYDRLDSAFSKTPAAAYRLSDALEGARHLHLSGITPALGTNAAELCRIALQEAKERGLATSFDLNYRADLWSPEEAARAFCALFPYVDLCIASSDGVSLVGVENGGRDPAACRRAAESLKEKYGFSAVALTVRESVSASFNRLSGVLLGKEFSVSPTLSVDIVDRVGGGDAFAAGLIHALLNGFSEADAVAFATACNAYKHTLFGDTMSASEAEIFNVLRGDTRIRR